jgi:hypothetical protein
MFPIHHRLVKSKQLPMDHLRKYLQQLVLLRRRLHAVCV